MEWVSQLVRRLAALIRRDQLDRDLQDEMCLHRELREQQNLESGMTADEAHYAARRRFGNEAIFKEVSREMWTGMWFAHLIQDLRYGLRQLRRSPGFTTVAVLSLALGIGANTAVFSVLNAVLLKALPVREPGQLVQLEVTYRGKAYDFFSYPAYLSLRDTNQAFSNLFAWAIRGMNASFGKDENAEPVTGAFVSGNYYSALGVPALIGRTILPEDDRKSAAPVVVLSYGAWQKRFGGDPHVIGRTITLERVPVTIVGVTPAWFFGTEVGRSFELTVPLSLQPLLNPDRPFLARADAQWIRLMARLAPGVTEQQARAQCAVLWPQILAEVDPKGAAGLHNFGLRLDPASTGLSQLRENFFRPLFVLLTIAGLVLLIACANVANLLLARASARQREVAVRFALGANRWRLARQMFTESVLLALLGSVAGLVFAAWGAPALVGLLSVGNLDKVTLNAGLDWRVLAFTIGVGLLTAALFGVVPALKVARTGLETDLHASGRGLTGRRGSVSKALIAAQVALSLPLVLGAGLFARSLRNLLTVDTGFNREGVLMVHIGLARAGYKDTALATAYQQLLQRIGALPGVRAASLSVRPPLTGGGGTFFSASGISVDGRRVPATTTGYVYTNIIASHFFETLSTPLLAGRDFADRDSQEAPRVIIVSEALAREFFPNESAIGHQIQIDQAAPAEIVGVVKTMKYETLRETSHYIVFEPYAQDLDNAGAAYLEVRGVTGLGSLAAAVQRVLVETVPQVPVETLTLNDWVNQFLTQDRLTAVLASGFGLLAILLAAVGLYGVMAYGVAQRTGEIGVRMALGAQRANVLRLVLREGATLLLIGVAVGLPLALALGRFVASMLFNLNPSDPLTLVGATVILASAAVAAAYLPARRAAAVDPMVALRYE